MMKRISGLLCLAVAAGLVLADNGRVEARVAEWTCTDTEEGPPWAGHRDGDASGFLVTAPDGQHTDYGSDSCTGAHTLAEPN